MENSNTKFPMGIHNKQCIGPCYDANVKITHPITLEYVTDNKPFCPTHEWEQKDPKTGKIDKLIIDGCYGPTKLKDISHILLPNLDFDPRQFLKAYYDLENLDDVLEFVTNNKNLSYLTHMRIFDCAWKVYCKNLDFVDDRMTEFYITVIKKDWIKYVYSYVKKYIKVDGDKIYISKNNQDNHKIEKINFFIDKFVTKNNINIFLTKFIDKTKKWENIADFNQELKNEYIKYTIKQLESK